MNVTLSKGTRRFAHGVLSAAALAVAAATFGHPAIASAEFDVETYDGCMRQPHVEDSEETYHAACCLLAHGTWDQNTRTCAAIDSDRIIGNIQNIPVGPKLQNIPSQGSQADQRSLYQLAPLVD